MHACGHDVHVGCPARRGLACWRRGARTCPGRYVFLFQPAEEALCGAKAMLERGALDRHGGRAPRRLPRHLRSCPRASWRCARGIAMSEANSLRITLTGPGGHGAMPSAQGDVIRATAELVSRLRRGGRRAALRGAPTASAARARCTPGTAVNVVPDLGPGHGHAAHLHRGPARGGARSACRTCATEVGDDQGVHVELEVPEHTPRRGERRRR